jgi:plastin-1
MSESPSTPRKQATVSRSEGHVGTHSYTQEELVAFSEYINVTLGKDANLQHVLPLKDPKDLFTACGEGVLLCKLINSAVPGTIDERVINKKTKLNAWERNENHELAINSAKGIGCTIVNVGQEDINNATPHIILGVVWQIIKIGLFFSINLKEHPELVRLLEEGEAMSDFLKLSPDQILIRWVNYHLKQAGSSRRIQNFSGDIKDSEVYTILLKQVCPNGECDMGPMAESDLTRRAEKVLNNADKIGCKKFLHPQDIVKGTSNLNMAFVANLFNTYPALAAVNANDYADLMDFDGEGSREERSFKFWIQSLGEDINNLFEDLRDGVVLLKVFDKVQPGIVNWKKANLKPKNKYQCIENTNYCVDLAKQLNFSTVNVGGTDIYEKNKKIVLGVVWQLMRLSLLNTLKDLGGHHGKDITEQDILEWANGKVSDHKIDSFKDSSLKTGFFLCMLCAAISPRSVNVDMITPGETSEDAHLNAKYAISVARKIGAVVFLLWEDIVEVKPKMIFAFVASLAKVGLRSN